MDALHPLPIAHDRRIAEKPVEAVKKFIQFKLILADSAVSFIKNSIVYYVILLNYKNNVHIRRNGHTSFFFISFLTTHFIKFFSY